MQSGGGAQGLELRTAALEVAEVEGQLVSAQTIRHTR